MALLHRVTQGLPLFALVTPESRKDLPVACDGFLTQPIQVDELFAKLQPALGLQWRYVPVLTQASRPASEFVYPEAADLEKLYHLAGKGRIAAIEEESHRLEQADVRDRSFAVRLREISQTFELDKIQAFLQPPP